MLDIGIEGCLAVPVQPRPDERGCLFEIFRGQWPDAFETVQWNACVSRAGVMRGVHVHVDYSEFYTLPMGRVWVDLKDIRRESSTFLKSAGFEWSSTDGFAVTVPEGVAHAVYFFEKPVLVFGLSSYWREELDVVGCRWDCHDLGLDWPVEVAAVCDRDSTSGTSADMVTDFETMTARHIADVAGLAGAAPRP